jgi:hypothetical protein
MVIKLFFEIFFFLEIICFENSKIERNYKGGENLKIGGNPKLLA